MWLFDFSSDLKTNCLQYWMIFFSPISCVYILRIWQMQSLIAEDSLKCYDNLWPLSAMLINDVGNKHECSVFYDLMGILLEYKIQSSVRHISDLWVIKWIFSEKTWCIEKAEVKKEILCCSHAVNWLVKRYQFNKFFYSFLRDTANYIWFCWPNYIFHIIIF